MTTNIMSVELKKLQNKLLKIEGELEKVRSYNVFDDGWQTQRFAKKSRKYDMLALEKFELLKKIEELEKKIEK